jgi:hypothetical protein
MATNTTENATLKTDLEIEKLRLEQQKLSEEIRHLKRPLYMNPQYAGPLAAVIVAAFTIAFAFLNGNFEAKTSILESKRLVIENQIKDFQQEKLALQADISKTKQQIAKLEVDKMNLRTESTKYQLEYLKSKNQYYSVQSRLDSKLNNQKHTISRRLIPVIEELKKGDNNGAYVKLRAIILDLNDIYDPLAVKVK